jgi:putative membrane protein
MEHHPELSHPRTPLQFLRLYLTGFAMGAADIVPGVSGGTMAFILGIYENLIDAIKSFNLGAIRLAIGFKVAEFIRHTSLFFLIALGLGILTAIFALSNILGTLLETQPTYVFAFFGGLILASIVAVGIKIRWGTGTLISLIVAAVAAYIIVGLPVLQNADHSLPVLFVSGAIAICAMILPGISGSFILLILGQYEFVLGAVRSLDIMSLAAVAAGCVVGIVIFSRVLSYLLHNHEQVTIAALVGFMIGSLRTIWERASAGTELIPNFGAAEIALAVALVVAGFVLVSTLDHLQSGQNPALRWLWKRDKKAIREAA